MKRKLSLFTSSIVVMSQNILAHNINHSNAGSEGLLHYLTEWHHGGPFWVIGAIALLVGFFFFKKTKN